MNVHGLNADASGARHLREAHGSSPKQSGRQLLHLNVHRNTSVFVKECTRLDQNQLAWLQRPLEDIAISMKDQ